MNPVDAHLESMLEPSQPERIVTYHYETTADGRPLVRWVGQIKDQFGRIWEERVFVQARGYDDFCPRLDEWCRSWYPLKIRDLGDTGILLAPGTVLHVVK